MSTIQQNLYQVQERIAYSAKRFGRDEKDIALLAVSKKFGPESLREAIHAGQYSFGENYLQEALEKIAILSKEYPKKLRWHYIGAIQSNKTRSLAENFDWVHTVDSENVAQRLSIQRPRSFEPLQICIQVNISMQPSKHGIAPNDVLPLAIKIAQLPQITLRGIMAIPSPSDDEFEQRRPFFALQSLLKKLQKANLNVDTLSMGMSADMDAAIAEGATIVRIGSAIFGARS